jgi:hypothetical protein
VICRKGETSKEGNLQWIITSDTILEEEEKKGKGLRKKRHISAFQCPPPPTPPSA